MSVETLPVRKKLLYFLVGMLFGPLLILLVALIIGALAPFSIVIRAFLPSLWEGLKKRYPMLAKLAPALLSFLHSPRFWWMMKGLITFWGVLAAVTILGPLAFTIWDNRATIFK